MGSQSQRFQSMKAQFCRAEYFCIMEAKKQSGAIARKGLAKSSLKDASQEPISPI